MKQEVMNVLNSEKEEQLVNETMNSRIVQLLEENAQLKNELASRDKLLVSRNELLALKDELLASKDEYIKSMKAIGELSCEIVQLKEQLVMAKETNKEQSNRINQLEEERSQQLLLLDNVTKQNDLNDMEKQLHQEKEELKEAQEKHAKAEEEYRQKQQELNNRTKEVEQQKNELDNMKKEVEQQKEELDNRKEELDTREQHLDEEHNEEVAKLNTRIDEYSSKQKEYDEVIDVLLQALADSGKRAKYAIEKTKENTNGSIFCEWRIMHISLAYGYKKIWLYLMDNLTNNVSKEKDLMGTISPNGPFFNIKYLNS